MRPYLAVVRDSFREAMASRVLPFLLVFLTLVLLLLAPVGLKEQAAWQFAITDVRDARGLAAQMRHEAEEEAPAPGDRLWPLLSDRLKRQLERTETRPEGFPVEMEFREELNSLLQRSDLYDETAWQEIELGEEARDLLKEQTLSQEQVARLNRLLLDAAYPRHIRPAPQSTAFVTWFGYEPFRDVFEDLGVDRKQARQFIEGQLSTISNWLIGKFGVFVAIVVTASVIPRMFEPGSIDLLLSKPVSRPLLFLTKFFSGCAFILINAGYFMLGLWLILGLRLDLWSTGLLWSVPVFLFVFSIIYSISALAGVLWGNAILAVLAAIGIWAFCALLGTVKETFDMFRNAEKPAVLVEAGETLLMTNRSGETFEWQPQTGRWDDVFTTEQWAGPGMPYPLVGPVYDPHRDQLIAIDAPTAGFGMMGGTHQMLVGRRAEEWRRRTGIQAPPGITSLFVRPEGELIAVGPTGLYSLREDPAERRAVRLFGFQFGDPGAGFTDVGPRRQRWATPFAAGMHPEDGSLAVFSGGRLLLLQREDNGRYAVRRKHDLETDKPAVVGYAGNAIVVALEEGRVLVFNEELEQQTEFRPFRDHQPQSVVASPDGRWFAVVFHHQRLWLYDAEAREPVGGRIAAQGDITTATFTDDGRLLVGDGVERIAEYRLDPLRRERHFAGEPGTRERIYQWGVRPLHAVLPQPGDLDQVVNYLFTRERTAAAVPGTDENLRAERVVFDVWRPIWTNLAFLIVILAVTCLYVTRKDF